MTMKHSLDPRGYERPPEVSHTAKAGILESLTITGDTSTNAAGPASQAQRPVSGIDQDSSRSFEMESDYYGDATIESMAAPTPRSEARKSARATRAPEARTASQPTRRRAQPSQSPESEEQEDEDDDEQEVTYPKLNANLPSRRWNLPGHEETIETTNPIPAYQAGILKPRPRSGLARNQSNTSTSRKPNYNDANDEEVQDSEDEELRLARAAALRRGLETRADYDPQAPGLTQRRTSRAARPNQWSGSSDDSEIEEQLAREQAEGERRTMREIREAWRQRLIQALQTWPLSIIWRFFQRERDDRHDDWGGDFDELAGDDNPTNFLLLLYPLFWLEMMVALFDWIMDRLIILVDALLGVRLARLGPRRGGALQSVIRVAAVLFLVLLGAGALLTLTSWLPLPEVESPSIFEEDLSSSSGLVGKVGNLIPSVSWPSMPSFEMPSFEMPSFGRGSRDDDEGLWVKDDDNKKDKKKTQKEPKNAAEYFEKYESQIAGLTKANKLHEDAMDKLQKVLPRVVHMDRDQKGQLSINPEFWHALRDLIKKDEDILTLEKVQGEYQFTIDQQWRSIVQRLVKDPTFTKGLNVSGAGLGEDVFKEKMASFWDDWVKKNNDKVRDAIGPLLSKIKSISSDEELDNRLNGVVREHLRGQNQTLVGRDEFYKHVEKEFAAHKVQVQAQIEELQPKLKDYVKESIRMAMNNAPDAMTKADVTMLVKGLIAKSIADLNLKALAKGKILSYWDAVLKNQVNYFGIGAGATIDVKRSNPTYDFYNKGVKSEESYKKGIAGILPNPPIAALAPWEEEGDCWCASRSLTTHRNPQGSSLSVQLGYMVIPQHIVIEHILPGATTDPDARPKHIEVWARFDHDDDILARVQDFSATHYPDKSDEWDYEQPKFRHEFVKISQFVYESDNLENGVHVEQLNSELSNIGASTDHIIIRAVSNYGSFDHTCFYRVRMFGEVVKL